MKKCKLEEKVGIKPTSFEDVNKSRIFVGVQIQLAAKDINPVANITHGVLGTG